MNKKPNVEQVQNLPQIVGLTKALELAITNQDVNNVHLMNLKRIIFSSVTGKGNSI